MFDLVAQFFLFWGSKPLLMLRVFPFLTYLALRLKADGQK